MTETEMKLALLRYSTLSKEKADAAYMWGHAGESVCYESKWSMCMDEMEKIEDELRKYGYKFTCVGSKTEDRVCFNVYKIVPIDNC